MSVSLVFDCGSTLECQRDWLVSCSDVLGGALTVAKEILLNNSSGVQLFSLAIKDDKLGDWQQVVHFLQHICQNNNAAQGALLDMDFQTAAIVLKLADKYNMQPVTELVIQHLTSKATNYSQAPATSDDESSIWRWLQFASKLNQQSLLQHYKSRIISQRLVPNNTADVAGLHPTDLADLLVSFMQQHAEVRYKCLGCAGRHSTEVRLCSRCSFCPHIRV